METHLLKLGAWLHRDGGMETSFDRTHRFPLLSEQVSEEYLSPIVVLYDISPTQERQNQEDMVYLLVAEYSKEVLVVPRYFIALRQNQEQQKYPCNQLQS